MTIRLLIFTLAMFGCGFGKLDAKKQKTKEFSISSENSDHSQDENLTKSSQLDSTEVGNGHSEELNPNVQGAGSNGNNIAKNLPIESTEIGNGQKPEMDNNTPGEGTDPETVPIVITAAYLTSCVLSTSKVDCNIPEGESYDFQNLVVYDLNKNQVPTEQVNYLVKDDQLQISIEGDAQIGRLEVEESEVDLPMNVADESMRDILIGTYNSPVWGDLEIRFSDGDVLVIYVIDGKTIGYAQGEFNEDNGIVSGNWCERSIKKDGKIEDKKISGSGQLEFHFEYGEDQQVQAKGQWNMGEGTEWHNDWNLNKLNDNSIYDEYFQEFDDYKCD